MKNNMNFVNISIQDHTGDRKLRLSWDTTNTEAAKEAQKRMEEMFIDLQNQGYRFFTCKKVLGLFPKKGKEVITYDPKIGELIYELGEKRTETKTELVEIELDKTETKTKYEEPKKFEPKKENIDTSRDYVATKPMRAG